MVTNSVRWTVQDLATMSDANDDWCRYEIIDGELSVTRAPHFRHQTTSSNLCYELKQWSRRTQLGDAVEAPGVIFSDADAVIPDVIWASHERIENRLDSAGHFVIAPELVIEVISSGTANEQRDYKTKLALYAQYGVQEYWIANWRAKTIEVYRRQMDELVQIETLHEDDSLTSPLLPDFKCEMRSIFE